MDFKEFLEIILDENKNAELEKQTKQYLDNAKESFRKFLEIVEKKGVVGVSDEEKNTIVKEMRQKLDSIK